MQLEQLSQSELQSVEGGLYNNSSPFSTKNKFIDGVIIGAAAGSAWGGVGAFVGGLIGGLLSFLF